jgi:hypothetical protein
VRSHRRGKTLMQAGRRRRCPFDTLVQRDEPAEDFVDPASARHDDMVAALSGLHGSANGDGRRSVDAPPPA